MSGIPAICSGLPTLVYRGVEVGTIVGVGTGVDVGDGVGVIVGGTVGVGIWVGKTIIGAIVGRGMGVTSSNFSNWS